MRTPFVGRVPDLTHVVERLRAGRPLVVAGPAGVGKSRLAIEARELLAAEGWDVEVVTGSDTSSSVTFGATAHLLPDAEPRDPHQLLRLAGRHLERRAEHAPLLLAVDDAPLLDPASATLVASLVEGQVVTGLLTVRSPGPTPDAIARLWRSGPCERIELRPLARAEVEQLLDLLLGGPADARLRDEVWRLTRGNPLFVREVVQAARAEGAITADDRGTWHAVGSLVTSVRLEGLITSRISHLTEKDRSALELVAVAEPVRERVIDRALGRDVLERLEVARLVAYEPVTQRFRTGHPLHGEVLRESMPRSRFLRHAARLAQTLVALGDLAPGEALQAGRYLLDTEAPIPPELARQGAEEALRRFDGDLAERLIRALPSLTSADELVLGNALAVLPDGRAADEVFRRVQEHAADAGVQALATLSRARNLRWMLGEVAVARQVLEAGVRGTADPGWVAALQTELAVQEAAAGDLGAAAAASRRAIAHPGLDPRVELQALVVLTLTQAMSMRGTDLDRSVDRGLELAGLVGDEEPLARDQLELNRAQWQMYAELDIGEQAAREHADVPGPMQGLWHAMLGMVLMMRGQLRGARRRLRDGASALGGMDPFGNLPMVWALERLAAGQAGVTSALPTEVVEAGRQDVRVRTWGDRATAWQRAVTGDLAGAAALATVGGQRAIDGIHVLWGCAALHDAVRFGFPELVRDRLVAASSDDAPPIVRLHVEHACAATDQDTQRLRAVARAYHRQGSPLLAAETLGQAARMLAEAGGPLTAVARTATRAAYLLDACDGAATPGVIDVGRWSLTPRERDVVRAAAAGRTNRDIAAELGLAVRTVENHLHRAYRRLGVDAREQLETIVSDVAPAGPEP